MRSVLRLHAHAWPNPADRTTEMPQTEPVASALALAEFVSNGIRNAVASAWMRAALTILCLVIAPGPAHAAYVCTYSSSGVVFGVFTGSALTSTGLFTITCTGSGTS